MRALSGLVAIMFAFLLSGCEPASLSANGQRATGNDQGALSQRSSRRFFVAY